MILPLDVIRGYRATINMTIDIYGFDVKLYIPQNIPHSDKSIYRENTLVYGDPINTKTFIEWKPTMKRLRGMGIFVDDAENLPIIAWLKGNEILDTLQRNCLMAVPINHVSCENEDFVEVNEETDFELVDCLIKNTYNATVVQCWKIAPSRARARRSK